jgi:hypothetical protein
MRFQELMPDVLHWLGITRIDRFVSMSDMKYNAIVNSGIEIGQRIAIPEELIPADAMVEIAAKQAAGYYTEKAVPDAVALAAIKGRSFSRLERLKVEGREVGRLDKFELSTFNLLALQLFFQTPLPKGSSFE